MIDVALRSSVIVFVGLVLSAVLRGRSAALRHSVLVAAMVGAAAVVPLSLVVPQWNVPLLGRLPSAGLSSGTSTKDAAVVARGVGARAGAMSATPAADATPAVTVWPATEADATVETAETAAGRVTALASRLALVWIGGAIIGATWLMIGVGRLLRVLARATPLRDGRWVETAERLSRTYGMRRPIVLLQTDVPDLLATWGLLRPRVLLPSHARGWSEDRIHVVLCHELAHIRRLDWIVQLGADLLQTIYWFNPLLWMACTRLRRESEHACDDAVLRAGVSGQEYAGHLLEVARSCRRAGPAWASAVPMARSSTLERRIAAMLNPRLERAALSRRAVVLTALMLIAITLPIAAMRGVQTPRPLTITAYDTSGAVIPGVELGLENAALKIAATGTTDQSGRYVFDALPPGTYDLQAKQTGFTVLRQTVELMNAKDWDRALTLGVSDVQETLTIRATATPTPTPRPSSGAPVPIRVGGNIRAPQKLNDVLPVYPDSMRKEGREGVVVMDGVIGRDGAVTSVRVLSAQIHPDFAIAAVEAVRQWRFSPTLLNGKPVEVVMTVSVSFSLDQ